MPRAQTERLEEVVKWAKCTNRNAAKSVDALVTDNEEMKALLKEQHDLNVKWEAFWRGGREPRP